MPAYGIDTSIFVRLLTGQPAADYQATLKRLTAIRSSQPEHIFVANIVIAEAYAVLQHHYGLGKIDARTAILSVLTSGLIEPAGGEDVLDALRATKEPGLTDRLISLDYHHQRATVLTLDRKMAALAGCERL
jgi:predicted nucleic acid-binding protein